MLTFGFCFFFRQIVSILNKAESKRSGDDERLLGNHKTLVKQILERRKRRVVYKERMLEKEDEPEEIETKALRLAQAIARSNHLMVYTGAGISTSAKIPDYRGSQGIWTLLAQGKDIGEYDLSLADPTYTHMALSELHRRGILKHVVSQNCDGLHLRSGLPRFCLSEVHGNMYVEVCKNCKPNVEYWRLFDTTQRTSTHKHKTNRRCRKCGKPLIDTIVHFGERGQLKWPLNWAGATPHTEKTDAILCLGSSLKVLRKYNWLWAIDKPIKKRPKLFIVNLQWTPKDKVSALKINGKCDEVMRLVMKHLNIDVPEYNRIKDPIFAHATLLLPEEQHTASQPMLKKAIKDEICGESSSSNGFQVKQEPLADNVEVKKEPTLQQIPLLLSPPSLLTPQQLYINNLLLQQQLNNYNIVLNAAQLQIKNEANPDSTTLPPKLPVPPLVPCSPNGIRPATSPQSTPHQQPIPQSPPPVNVIKIDTASSLFGNLRHMMNPGIDPGSLKSPTATDPKPMTTPSKIHILMKPFMPAATDVPKLIPLTVPVKPEPDKPSDNCTVNQTETPLNLLQSSDSTETNTEKQSASLPQWYDVNYAYSGLHSIIHPPPPNVNLWGGSPNKQQREAAVECKFCFENYRQPVCQFYATQPAEFAVKSMRRGKTIVCECCDFSDEEDEQQDEIKTEEEDKEDAEEKESSVKAIVGKKSRVRPGWYGKGYGKLRKKKKRFV
ncbi:AAEL006655-PA [Aedes aegypti]|uniref:protein acetyllysine N-acetyltransferase n=1 Tax=Aedes aegypti TaxID=7159 RepID=Q175I4_AEDAE|nr:AAEL006655-PA [Aedes aegypti]